MIPCPGPSRGASSPSRSRLSLLRLRGRQRSKALRHRRWVMPPTPSQGTSATSASETDAPTQGGTTLRPSHPSTTFENVGRLPASFVSLLPKILPSAMVAVLPAILLQSASLRHNQLAHVNHRLARLYSADALLPSDGSDEPKSAFPPIVLLSPCLYAALGLSKSKPSVTIRRATDLPRVTTVALQCMIPHPLPAKEAARVADMAKRALQRRDVREGDILPASAIVWLRVVSVEGSGLVKPQTDVAISLTTNPSPAVRDIDESLRAWAFAKWRRPPVWQLSEYAARLVAGLDMKLSVLLMVGAESDLGDIAQVVAVGRVLHWVKWRTEKEVVEAIARAELAGGGAVVVQGLQDDVVKAVVAHAARREGGDSYLSLHPEPLDVCCVVLAESGKDISPSLLNAVDAQIIVPKATDAERREIVQGATQETGFEKDIPERHLKELVRMSVGYAREEVYGLGRVYGCDGIEECRKAVEFFGKGKVTVDAGGVTWDDIGGLEQAKEQIMQLVQLADSAGPDEDGEVEKKDEDVLVGRISKVNINRRVGILLYGPPGTGKTLLARAVAGECQCSFISVKGPELFDMYVGESERNVRHVFERAVLAAPCVIFFDEVDALAPNRGGSSDSGGVADRVVSQLLGELDAIVTRNDIFVIAASNRPDLVDAALLRPGRLDKKVYVSMPATRQEQTIILKAQTRKFQFEGHIDFEEALSHAPPPPTLSGADLYGLASTAWMKAATRAVELKESRTPKDTMKQTDEEILQNDIREAEEWANNVNKIFGPMFSSWRKRMGIEDTPQELPSTRGDRKEESSTVRVNQEDFVAAAKDVQPSLSLSQLQEYEDLRTTIETGRG